MGPVVAAVDLGGESGRVMAARLTDGGIELQERHRFSTAPSPRDGHLAWDIDGIEGHIREGLRRVPGCASVGIDGWGVDIGLLDGDERLVTAPYSYRDPLTDGILPALRERVSTEALFARTGIQMMEINTLCQLLALSLREDEVLRRAERMLLVPDLLLHRLGATAVAERTNASTTQMLGVAGAWVFDIVDACGIERSLCPDVVEPGTARGVLQPLHGATGVRRAPTLIGVASHDTASAVIAAPLSADGTTAYISSGTWSLVGVESPAPVLNAAALRSNLSNEHGWNGSYRVLRNVMGLWLLQQCRAAFAADGAALTYAEMAMMAEAAPAFTAVIDPDEPAFLRPGDITALIAAACRRNGGAVPDDRGTLLRVVLESLALRYRWTIDALIAAVGAAPRALCIVGGGSRNELLCRLTADATGLPVTAGPAEATALGNAVVQLIVAGALADVPTARALVAADRSLRRYEPRVDARWDAAYARFCALPGVGEPG